MIAQLTTQPAAQTVKPVGMWCAMSLSKRGSAALRHSYLGTAESVITAHQASAFTSNPLTPEADHKAALD